MKANGKIIAAATLPNRKGCASGVRTANNLTVRVSRYLTLRATQTDVSVFRPTDSKLVSSLSLNKGFRAVSFGTNGDQIAPGDMTATARRTQPSGVPRRLLVYLTAPTIHSCGTVGLSGDITAAGDSDRDGKTDICVYRPSTGTFYLLYSSTIPSATSKGF